MEFLEQTEKAMAMAIAVIVYVVQSLVLLTCETESRRSWRTVRLNSRKKKAAKRAHANTSCIRTDTHGLMIIEFLTFYFRW